MTKLSVFIDFEAISMPFSREASIADEFPYAYTLGLYVGKKFKTKTFVFDFQHDSIHNVNEIFRTRIISDIRTILDNKSQPINKSTIKFIGWSPVLERKILAKVFPGIEIQPLNKGFELSLSRLTPEIKDDYFVEFRKIVAKNMSEDFIARRSLNQDGALAALAGYLLYASTLTTKGKFYFSCDSKLLVEEIKKYSKEDVTRMAFLNDNRALFDRRKEKAFQTLTAKQKVIKALSRSERLLESLEHFDHKKTVEMTLEDLKNDIQKLKAEKLKLEKDFENI